MPTSDIGAAMTATDWKCVKAYADRGMDATKAARSIYYHRNTLNYHLKCAKKKTGLDPKNFYDLIKLIELYNREKGES